MKYAEFRELSTPRLLLRRLQEADTPQFYEHIGGSAKVTQYMLWEPHRNMEESAASIRKVLNRYQSGRCYRWAITLRSSGCLISILELLSFDEKADTCSFAYMLGEAYWGQGYGTEALKAAFAFAFSEMEISAITADHFAENGASGAVMRKAGMRYLKTIPGKYKKHGTKHDAPQYRITREEWDKETRH